MKKNIVCMRVRVWESVWMCVSMNTGGGGGDTVRVQVQYTAAVRVRVVVVVGFGIFLVCLFCFLNNLSLKKRGKKQQKQHTFRNTSDEICGHDERDATKANALLWTFQATK